MCGSFLLSALIQFKAGILKNVGSKALGYPLLLPPEFDFIDCRNMLKTVINRKIRLFILLVAIFIFLLVSPLSYKQDIKYLETPLSEVVYSVQHFFFYLVDTVKVVWIKYISQANLHEDNEALRREISILAGEISRMKNDIESFERLNKLFGYDRQNQYDLVAAMIIGSAPTNWFQTVVISKGAKDGIGEGMGVISPAGVVGKVIKVSPNFSRVLLLIDRNIIVPAIIKRTREQGIVEGSRDQAARMKYLPIQSKVEIGDQVITSGLVGNFPKGIVIGEVTDIYRFEVNQFIDLEIKPVVRFSRLEELFVVLPNEEMKKEMADLKVGRLPN